MAKNPGGSAWQGQKTHCPQGHPYDEENTYRVPKTGDRQCRACRAERRSRESSADYYVEGYRDQECPICGLRWFVDASHHVRWKHGQRIEGLVSEDCRFMRLALLTDLGLCNYDPKATRIRHRRWAKTIQREAALGGDYRKRLARLWRITDAGVSGRIRAVVNEGLFEIPNRPPATMCRRGHPINEENSYLKSDGGRQCRACQRLESREQRSRRYYEAHHEQEVQRSRRYYEAHREQILERKRRSREEAKGARRADQR